MKVSEDRARSAQEDNVDNSEAHDVEDENARLISESNVDNDIEKGQQARESVHEDRVSKVCAR